MSDNPFSDEGDRATAYTKRKIERGERVRPPMVPGPAERKIRQQGEQLRRFKRWKQEVKRGLMEGEFAPEIIQLVKFLRRIPAPEQLLYFVRNSRWLTSGHVNMRMSVLEYLDECLVRWNIRHGLSPFDDGLPDEPDTPFIAIRRLLTKEGDTYEVTAAEKSRTKEQEGHFGL